VTAPLGDHEKRVGQQLRRLREERGWSQQKMAQQVAALGGRYAKWRQGMIDKSEKGQRPIRVNELFDLAGVFGVGPEVLLAFDVDTDVLEVQIAETEALLREAETDHSNAALHLQQYYERAAGQREMSELAERDSALRATRYRSALEVLYRLRANPSMKAGG
jgi:transcriptional regulator with XRE-family HTH domain